MTFEEAKKILEKEGFYVEKGTRRGTFNESFAKYEDSTICEAMQVVYSAGYKILMFKHAFEARKARLKKEYEKNTKAPGPGEEQPKENDLKAATDAFVVQANEIMRLKKENAELLETIDKMKEGNPALEEAASQFNDALLDEQAKKTKRLGKEIARLNGIIHDKNAILSDVAEELRLSKIREKNLVEVSQKYMKEVEAQKDLADDISLKYDGAKYNLKLRIDECEKLKKELEKMTKLIETVRKGSKEYCDYGIAAGKMIQKMAKVIVNEDPVSSEDFKEYRRLANGRIFMPEISEEELMKLQEKACVDIAEEGKDLCGVIVLCGKDYIDALKKAKDVWQE